jgi:riboflavin kinase/FMN adenylyltransferase
MKVFRHIEELNPFKNAVITIGTFDGVHLGHQQIIARINQLAKDNAGESVIITFHPHPRLVIQPDGQAVQLLSTPNEKIELLEKYGVNNVVIIPFSRDFSEQSAEYYIEHFLVKNFQPKHIVIGYDHKFGRDRKGDFALLEKYKTQFGFSLEEIDKQTLEDITISSTKIRHALNDGEIEQANELLGHAYTLSGIVIKGLQNGRKLGYPTANIQPDEFNKLIPKKRNLCRSCTCR